MTIYLLVTLFFVGFFINLLWELLHSTLYKTCWDAPLNKFVYLMVKGSTFDGIVIVIIYFITRLLFGDYYLVAFVFIAFLFAYGWEIYSGKAGRWGNFDKMPLVFGAGLTPIVQLAITGAVSIYVVVMFFK